MQRRRLKIIFGAAFLGLVLLSFTTVPTNDKYFEIAKNMKIFAKLFQEVNTYYVDEVSPTQMMNVGIEAMLNTLDPYTNYIPEDKIEDYRTMTTGEYGGLGVVVGNRNGKVTVLMPNEGFAAFKAGLRIGDEIVKVDNISITEKNAEEISKLLKGQAGTEVKLTINRYGQPSPLEVTIERENIHLKNVPYYGMVTDNIGMIKLSDFTRKASKEVSDALVDLKGQGAEKIILDLRGNPGGLLSEAIKISNIFLPKGHEIVTTKGKIEDWNRSHRGMNDPVDIDIPVAVLISGNSASAAEIVSGVIQDYDRGVLVGQRSFGKGLVQATRTLEYNSKLKVTVAKYYIPSGRCIQAIDYSHRDENGKAEEVPDSLRTAFKTKNGRTVYDGGGVKPDIEVKNFNYAQITRSLLRKNLIFDYATIYHHQNPEIASAKTFNLTDTDFEAFVKWLKDKDYDYKNTVEQALENLISSAKDDKYYSDIKSEIETLETKIYRSKESDLYKFQEELKEVLEEEIVKRYYLQNGEIEASFDDDTTIKEAIDVLNDMNKYKQILSAKH
ncbi:S41 family peptidase [Algivirga pacifica]|uniref:S41 family peptidase n=1 Tax=Algivirga pacifica TaxID=1162670 RepID=A0ABP9DKB6_9BACT